MLQRYTISGRDSKTGESIDLTVQADTIEEATAKASQRGISVESIAVEQTSLHAKPPTIPPTHETQEVHDNSINISHDLSKKSNHRWWLLIIGLIVLLGAPLYPIVPLLFGASILFLCFGVFISKVKVYSYRIIRLEPAKRWKNALRLTVYGAIGFYFVASSFAHFAIKAEEQRDIAQKVEAKAKAQRLSQEANKKVSMLASEAEKAWKNNDHEKAIELLEKAEKTLHVTNRRPIHTLRIYMANEDVRAIMSEAISAAESGKLDIVSEKIDRAIAVPNATDLKLARKFENYLAFTEDSACVKTALLRLPDEEIASLQKKGTIPNSFVSGYAGLDKFLAESALKEVEAVVVEKEKLRQAKNEKRRTQAEAAKFVNSGTGKKVPYDKWNVLGNPKTLDETNNHYWVAYLEKANVSFVSEKDSDMVIFAAFGAKKASEFLIEKNKKRKEQVESQFSAWNGSHHGLTEAIKASMNNPKSYKHVETVFWDTGEHLVVRTTFRGTNAFGGVVTNWVKAKVDLSGNVLGIIEQGS